MNNGNLWIFVALAVFVAAWSRRGLRPGQRRLQAPMLEADADAPIVVEPGRLTMPTALIVFPRGSA